MLDWRLAEESITEDCDEEQRDPLYRKSVKCKVFLGFTSNLISSGVRDTVRYLVDHHMVDVVVTTTGGIEEDLIKCLAPTYKGDFSLPGAHLRSKGLNRIGNLLVPNDNYYKFEDWIIPIFDQMLKEQTEEKVSWKPSKLIARLGKEINHESSYLYWAYKNNIKEHKSAKVVQFDLHTHSAVRDDSCLNHGSEMSYLQGRKETSFGEAVGCTFHYLVTENGLSVVLPAVSVASDFLPVETIGYRQSGMNTGIGCQETSNLEIKESKQPWSPWRVEI